MSLAGWTRNLSAMADRIAAMRKKVCDEAKRQKEGRILEFERWRPISLGVDILTSRRPTFEKWTDDTYWYVQGRRFVSREEMQRLIREYYERQARRLAGGD